MSPLTTPTAPSCGCAKGLSVRNPHGGGLAEVGLREGTFEGQFLGFTPIFNKSSCFYCLKLKTTSTVGVNKLSKQPIRTAHLE